MCLSGFCVFSNTGLFWVGVCLCVGFGLSVVYIVVVVLGGLMTWCVMHLCGVG